MAKQKKLEEINFPIRGPEDISVSTRDMKVLIREYRENACIVNYVERGIEIGGTVGVILHLTRLSKGITSSIVDTIGGSVGIGAGVGYLAARVYNRFTRNRYDSE